VEPAKKFYIFHQRHVGKSAYVEEGSSPAEYPVIAAAHSQQNSCVMSKTVREPINQASRQANSEVAANDIRIIDDAPDLIQALEWQSSIDMDKPKDLPARGARAGIHLPATAALALDKLLTESGSESICAIGASAVCNDDLRFRRSLAQMLKERSYQRRLIEYRDDDRELHSNDFRQITDHG
jgi:hypothetical protein